MKSREKQLDNLEQRVGRAKPQRVAFAILKDGEELTPSTPVQYWKSPSEQVTIPCSEFEKKFDGVVYAITTRYDG